MLTGFVLPASQARRRTFSMLLLVFICFITVGGEEPEVEKEEGDAQLVFRWDRLLYFTTPDLIEEYVDNKYYKNAVPVGVDFYDADETVFISTPRYRAG
jgi:hypothetical protein